MNGASAVRRTSGPAEAGRYVLFVSLLFAACHSAPAIRREAGLNVLLITIDTLRADALGVSGNPRASTPAIDRLAGLGVRFTAAHAHSVITLPSHVNILTGVSEPPRRARERRLPRARPIETLSTILKARGYRTGGVRQRVSGGSAVRPRARLRRL